MMNSNLLFAAKRFLPFALVLYLAPAASAQQPLACQWTNPDGGDSKACAWPNNHARGLVCPVDQCTPFLANGTSKDDPARICAYGPGGGLIHNGCRSLWYDLPSNSPLLQVPVTPHGLVTFLSDLDELATGPGEEAGWCLANARPPYKKQLNQAVTYNAQGDQVQTTSYKCEGFAKACEAETKGECTPGEEFSFTCHPEKWFPDPSTVPYGQAFTQRNDCGDEQPGIGADLEWARTGRSSSVSSAAWLEGIPVSRSSLAGEDCPTVDARRAWRTSTGSSCRRRLRHINGCERNRYGTLSCYGSVTSMSAYTDECDYVSTGTIYYEEKCGPAPHTD